MRGARHITGIIASSILKDVNSTPLIPWWAGVLVLLGLVAAYSYREGDSKWFSKDKGTDNASVGNAPDGPDVKPPSI